MSETINIQDEQIEEIPVISDEVFTIKLKKPFEFEGKTYKELRFDFSKLSGNDCLAIENELQMLGKGAVAPEFSGEYLIRFAARALEEDLGPDFIAALPAATFTKIRNRARSFLLVTG